MERRKFFNIGFGALAAAAIPAGLSATDFRKKNPSVWTRLAEKDKSPIDASIKAFYGKSAKDSDKVKLKAPDIAENGAVIPITVSTKLDAKTVTIYQDANPESIVAAFTVPKGGIVDYSIRIKMAKTGNVKVVVEGTNGKLYAASKNVKVTKGGCGG